MTLLIRTQQHWLPRSIDVLLTVIGWVGFFSLIYFGVREVANGIPLGRKLIDSHELIATLETLLMYALGALLIAAALLVWAKYNQVKSRRYSRRRRSVSVGVNTLSGSFRVSPLIIEFLQSEQVWILHNHEQGDLSAIELPGVGLILPADADHEQIQQLFTSSPAGLELLLA